MGQKSISLNSTEGGPFRSTGGRAPEGEGGESEVSEPNPPFKSTTECYQVMSFLGFLQA